MTVHPIWAQVIGVFTVITMLSFIGIWVWVWNGRHRTKYDALARMPMEDDSIEDDEETRA